MRSLKISDAELAEINILVEEIIVKATEVIIEKFYKIKSVELYHEIFVEALTEIIHIYNMPKPCTEFESTIDAWKQDRPAQLAVPDNLITSKLYLKTN